MEWVIYHYLQPGWGKTIGPFTSKEVKEFIQLGKIDYQDLVWKKGWGGWKKVCEIEVFRSQFTLTVEKQVQGEASVESRSLWEERSEIVKIKRSYSEEQSIQRLSPSQDNLVEIL